MTPYLMFSGLYYIHGRHPTKRERSKFGVRHELFDSTSFTRSNLVIELVKDHHPTACQTRPEMLERRANNIIDAAIGKNKFELEVGVFNEKLFEVFRDIEIVNMNNIIHSLRANELHHSLVILVTFSVRYILLFFSGLRSLEPIKSMHEGQRLGLKKLH